MKLSIVTTLYHSGLYIEEFYKRITEAADKITDDYEIILVNDGSPDNSLKAALHLYQLDPKIIVIDLSRNFGHHKAIMTGLEYAQGDFIFLIDVDLEEKPEILTDFWLEMEQEKDIDVIYGVQESRKGGLFEKISGEIFYALYNKLSSIPVPRNLVTVRLMKRNYVNALLKFKEQEIFLGGLWSATGFNQKPKVIVKHSHSATTYSLRKRVFLLFNAITSFSSTPLRLIFYFGLFTTFISILFVSCLVLRKIFWGIGVDGWTSIVASIWLLGGGIIFSIGIVGIYLSTIFIETKQRPYTLIKGVYKSSNQREIL